MPDFGGFINKVKDLAGKHPDQVHEGVDKAEDVAKEKTGDKYDDQIKQGGDKVEGFLGADQAGEADEQK
jgi:hypothetical protein